jgi:hypothetical protein
LIEIMPLPKAHVSAEMQPGQRIEQPCSQMQIQFPGPRVVTGKCRRDMAIKVMTGTSAQGT